MARVRDRALGMRTRAALPPERRSGAAGTFASRRGLARLAALCAVLPMLGPTCSPTPSPAAFRVGATRAEILAEHGRPQSEQVMTKRGDAIWGPIEDFWQQVPLGSSVEIWAYPVEGGSLELYFVDGSEQVQGTGFAPAGAVFESGP